MAIPDNLFRVFVETKRQNAAQTVTWARNVNVWYCLSTDKDKDPRDVAALWAVHYELGGAAGYFATGWRVTQYGGRNVSAGGPDVVQNVTGPSGGGPATALPPQVAVLVLGRTFAVRRQTRKWVPMGHDGWKDGETGEVVSTDLPRNDWWKGFLTQKVGAGFNVEPVVWDPSTETLSDIEEVVMMKSFRTIRRRSLANEATFT